MRKALIPAAGRGTRMLPFTHVVPKELAPLGSRPALDFVVREALEAGLDHLGVVVGPEKGLVRDYLERLRDHEELPIASLEFIFQEVPLGLAEAMALARSFSDGEPFALVLPDNIFLSPDHSLGRMVEAAQRHGQDAVGVIRVGHEQSGRYGNCGRIEFDALPCGDLALRHLASKGPGRLEIAPGETVLRACGRYICQPHVFDYIDRLRPEIRGEYSEVPVYQRIISERGAVGVELPGPLFDVGHPSGFLAANAFLAAAPEPRREDG